MSAIVQEGKKDPVDKKANRKELAAPEEEHGVAGQAAAKRSPWNFLSRWSRPRRTKPSAGRPPFTQR